MTGLGIAVAAFAGWLFTARWLYARWRGSDVTRRDCAAHGSWESRYIRPPAKCCMDKAPLTDGASAAIAVPAALFWPLVLAVALVRFRPPPTAAGQAEAKAALTARVAE